MRKHKSVVNNAESNNNNNNGGKNKSIPVAPETKCQCKMAERADRADRTASSSSSSRNPNYRACLETLLSFIGLS